MSSETNTAAPLIVYAEDHDSTREMVETIFRREGFRVVTAPDAERLIETVNRLCEEGNCPDLILSDVNFFDSAPRSGVKLTGIGAAFKIHEKFPDLPILFLTAYNDRTTRENAQEASNSEVMSKPFIPDELVSRVRDTLRFRVSDFEGAERRRRSINATGHARRKTDVRVEMSGTVAEVLQQVKGSARQ